MSKSTRRKLVLGVLGGIVVLVVIAAFVLVRSPDLRFELSLSRVVNCAQAHNVENVDYRLGMQKDTNDDKVVVIVRIRNPGSRCLWFGPATIQPKVGGRWLEAEESHWLNGPAFVAELAPESEKEFVLAVVPKEAEALRLSVEHRYDSLLDVAHRRLSSHIIGLVGENREPGFMDRIAFHFDQGALESLRRKTFAYGVRNTERKIALPLRRTERKLVGAGKGSVLRIVTTARLQYGELTPFRPECAVMRD